MSFILPILLFHLLLLNTSSLSPTIQPTNRYAIAGTHDFDTSPYYNMGSSSLTSHSFVLAFTKTRVTNTYHAIISVLSIEYSFDADCRLHYIIKIGAKLATSLQVLITSQKADKIRTLQIRYLILSEQIWPYQPHEFESADHKILKQSDPYTFNNPISGLDSMTITGSLKYFVSITGIDAYEPVDKDFDFYPVANRVSADSVDVTIYTIGTNDIQLNFMQLMSFCYNQDQINGGDLIKVSYINYDDSSNNNAALSYTGVAGEMDQNNIIIGMLSLHTKNINSWAYTTTINVAALTISSASANAFLYLNFRGMIFQFKYCPDGQPYLHVSGDQCYVTTCPVRTAKREIYMTCQDCNFDCEYCDASDYTVCLSCLSSDNRQFNATTDRCDPKAGFYQSNVTVAAACLTNCISCTSGTSCTTCASDHINKGTSCDAIVCSDITDCVTCHEDSNTIVCDSCSGILSYDVARNQCRICVDSTPYYFNASSVYTCYGSCPSRHVLNGDECLACHFSCLTCQSTDVSKCVTCSSSDNRQINGQACDPKATFYESGVAIAASCDRHCLSCTSTSQCTTCKADHPYNTTHCVYDCTTIANCTACSEIGTTSTYQCDTCDGTLTFDSSSGTCKEGGVSTETCGDAIPTAGEGCDDGNVNMGDGCSEECVVESYFVCNQTHASGYSLCFPTQIVLEQAYTTKQTDQNVLNLYLILNPSIPSLYQTLDWSQMLTTSHPLLQNPTFSYTSDQRILLVSQYTNDIEGQQIEIELSATALAASHSQLKYLNNGTTKVGLSADDNQILEYFQWGTYLMSRIIGRYFSYVYGGIALLLFLVGMGVGKLVALEYASVVQITYFSLIGIQYLNPPLQSLSYLVYSTGYNLKPQPYNYQTQMHKGFKSLQLNIMIHDNFNIMALIFMIPLTMGIVAFIVTKTCLSKSNKADKIYRATISQYVLYGFLYTEYLMCISLAVTFKYIDLQDNPQMIQNVAISLLFLLLFLCYFVAFCVSKSKYFGEFKGKLKKVDSSEVFVNFVMVQKMVTSFLLVACNSFLFVHGIIAAIFILQLLFILKKKPYANNKNTRPLANMFIIVTIQIIYLTSNMVSSSKKEYYQLYVPFVIVFLLLVCTVYSVIGIIQEYRDVREVDFIEVDPGSQEIRKDIRK